MSMQLSIYAGNQQEKPTVEINELSGFVWLVIQYGGAAGHGLTFHGRSRAQCERLAAAWLAMWDEPAREFDENGMFVKGADMQPGLTDRIVRPDPGPAGWQKRPTFQEEREDREERERPIHPEDGQPLDDVGEKLKAAGFGPEIYGAPGNQDNQR